MHKSKHYAWYAVIPLALIVIEIYLPQLQSVQMLNPHHTVLHRNNCSTRFKLLQDPKHLAAAALQ